MISTLGHAKKRGVQYTWYALHTIVLRKHGFSFSKTLPRKQASIIPGKTTVVVINTCVYLAGTTSAAAIRHATSVRGGKGGKS